MTRRSILHVVGDSRFGGGTVVVLELARAAAAAGYEAGVLTTDAEVGRAVRAAGLRHVSADVVRRPIRPWDVIGLVRLIRLLRRERPTVVHTHTSKAGFVGRLAARLARVPVVVHTAHGFPFHEGSSRSAHIALVWLERLAARWCDLLVTVSEHHGRLAVDLRLAPPHRVLAIPNGVDPARVASRRPRGQVRAELGIGDDDLAVLVTGRLAPQKGLPELLHAVSAVVAAGPSSAAPGRPILLLAGDGPSDDKIRELAAALGLGPHVLFLGFREDIGDLLEAADLVAVPSRWEGMSIALLEALAAARPVLATALGSNQEVTAGGACALLVPPRDRAALADGLRRLLGDPDLCDRLGKLGRARFEEYYTADRLTADYLACYARLGAPPPADETVRAATSADLAALVAMHAAAFPAASITRLGRPFLRAYYRAVLSDPDGVVLVAERDGRPVGLAAGYTDPKGFYARLRRRRVRLVLRALPWLVRRPALVPAARHGLPDGSPGSTADLVYLTVDPDFGGGGLERRLVEAFAARAERAGAASVSATTEIGSSNGMRRGYEHLGFATHRRYTRALGRRMLEYRRHLPRGDQ